MATYDAPLAARAGAIDTALVFMLAGAAGTVAFDLFGQGIAPLIGLGNLAPVGLARSTLGALGLPGTAPYGHIMHLVVVGLVAYPLGWFVTRAVQRRMLPGLGWLATSAAYGVGLWIVAIGGVAWFALGNPFLGFARIAWTALIGHVLYGIVTAAVAEWIARP